MILYRVKHSVLGTVVWDTAQDAADEVKMHLLEGSWGDRVIVDIVKMSEEDYEKLPEFRGY